MKNTKKQWQRVWVVYLFIFTLIYILLLNQYIKLWKNEPIIVELTLFVFFTTPVLVILVIFKLLAESILIAYAGWKTRQVGSSLFACFKVGVICCLAALLAGLVMQLSVEC